MLYVFCEVRVSVGECGSRGAGEVFSSGESCVDS